MFHITAKAVMSPNIKIVNYCYTVIAVMSVNVLINLVSAQIYNNN